MPTFWRYQNDRGEGPYSSQWLWSGTLRKEHSSEDQRFRRPSPMWDEKFVHVTPSGTIEHGIQYPKPEYFFACPSREILEDWFEGWHVRLAEFGFRVVNVESNDYYKASSGRQVAFKRS